MARSRKFLTVGALGVAAVALLAATTSTTGAYFTDSHNGAVNASTGAVVVQPKTVLSLNFAGLLPGVFQTKDLTYTAAGSAAEDIWLVFPTDNVPFRGGSGSAALGRFGHFAVQSATGGAFTSYNLTSGSNPCTVDANGYGGSDVQSDFSAQEPKPAYCPVPDAILLSSNLTYGQTQTSTVTFGFTKLLKSGQSSALAQVVPFKLVATQHGVLPRDVNNSTITFP